MAVASATVILIFFIISIRSVKNEIQSRQGQHREKAGFKQCGKAGENGQEPHEYTGR
jgi:hypothetical protein